MQMYTRFVSVLKGRAQGELVGIPIPVVSSRLSGAVDCSFEVAEYGVAFPKSNMPPVGVDS